MLDKARLGYVRLGYVRLGFIKLLQVIVEFKFCHNNKAQHCLLINKELNIL